MTRAQFFVTRVITVLNSSPSRSSLHIAGKNAEKDVAARVRKSSATRIARVPNWKSGSARRTRDIQNRNLPRSSARPTSANIEFHGLVKASIWPGCIHPRIGASPSLNFASMFLSLLKISPALSDSVDFAVPKFLHHFSFSHRRHADEENSL